MKNLILSLLFLFISAPINASMITGEYRFDRLDFEEEEQPYYRVKTLFSLSKKSNMGFALSKSDDYKYTWFISLEDLSKNFSMLMGNYYINFGSGLLTGSPTLRDPNPFRKVSHLSITGFKPSKSSNPDYAFYGVVPAFYFRLNEIDLSLKLFYSHRERFFKEDTDKYNYSLNGLLTHNRDSDYSIPVIVTDYGIILSLYYKGLCGEFHGINTALNSPENESLYWDYTENEYYTYGIKNQLGLSSFIKYQSDYLTLFLESAHCINTIRRKSQSREYDQAYQMGINFSSDKIKFKLSLKHLGWNYYPLFANYYGSSSSNNGLFFNLTIKKRNIFTPALYLSLEDNSRSENMDRNTLKSYITIRGNFSKSIKSIFSYQTISMENSGVKQSLKVQGKFGREKNHLESIVSFYKTENSYSSAFKNKLKLTIAKKFSLHIFYAFCHASENAPVYFNPVKLAGSSSPNEIISNKSHIYGLKTRVDILSSPLYFRLVRYHNLNQKNKTLMELKADIFF